MTKEQAKLCRVIEKVDTLGEVTEKTGKNIYALEDVLDPAWFELKGDPMLADWKPPQDTRISLSKKGKAELAAYKKERHDTWFRWLELLVGWLVLSAAVI